MILVLTIFVLFVAICLIKLNSKQTIVDNWLLLVSGSQRSLTANVSIKKANHQRSNKLHTFFLRMNALLPVWDKYFIALSAIGFPASGHIFVPATRCASSTSGRCWTLVCMHMCLGDVPPKNAGRRVRTRHHQCAGNF